MPNLVGTGLNQVPTNSMLGGMAYQDPNHASIKDLDLKNLSQINSEIADTATDVFVYDTRKDSDGGAWRKRTQNTSWYNETLNTSTRGSRKEFPAVAVIVAETTKVTIYDGDDPDLPMWMVFNVSNSTWLKLHSSGSQCSCISALNATLCAGGNGTGIRLAVVDFIKDNQYLTEAGYTYYQTNGIVTRNDTTTHINDGGSKSIVNNVVNDVAMTVLPNAPVDSATGLPVPTIAVATNDGVSVIKDDETIFDVIDSNGARRCYDVSFTKDHKIMHTGDLGAGVPHAGNVFVTNVLTADRTEYDNHGDLYRWYSTSAMYPRINGGNTYNTRVLDPLDVGGHHYAMADVGISLIEDGTSSSYGNTDGMVAYITSDYNTGYQHGDIKGAFLSDTSTTNATDSQKVNWNNGSDTSQSYGSSNNAQSVTIVSNTAITITASASDYAYYDVGFTPVSGKKYVAVLTGSISSGSGPYGLSTGGGFSINMRRTSNGTVGPEVMTSAGNAIPIFVANGLTVTVTLTIYELVEEDRSVNNTGLQVVGTITKSPVATGAELVAYSGFSASNYLTSARTAIDFGSSPNATICFISWVNQSTTGEYSYIMSAQDGTSTAPVGMAAHTSTGNFYVYEGTDVSSSSHFIVDGTWHHCVGIINGTSILGYVDGKKVIDALTTNPPNLFGIDRFNVGHFRSGTSNLYHQRGSLALSRVTKSIPSPEQVKKMYEDEKCLFHENAKATLYGSSDAVTALAFDDTTNLLHVGTSAGRSEFQGLCRINNTTDAVTTAISASNGLVAEQ